MGFEDTLDYIASGFFIGLLMFTPLAFVDGYFTQKKMMKEIRSIRGRIREELERIREEHSEDSE